MPKTVVITQSNYIPWRGYFDLIRKADELILLDGVQYTRRDWRNRNMIKTPRGTEWLSIPVQTKGNFHQRIDQTLIADPGWAEQHIRSIEVNYRRASAYASEAPYLYEGLRHAATMQILSDVNRSLIEAVCQRLGIKVPIRFCREILGPDALEKMNATERLVALAAASNATCYLSAPAAKAYLDEEKFANAGIGVAWMQYGPYEEYPQCWGPFAAQLSVIDLLLNCGDRSIEYLANTP